MSESLFFTISSLRHTILSTSKIILSAADLQITEKTSAKDLVTQYDRQVQERLIAAISELVPGAEFVSEESAEKGNIKADDTFIIDPIDGTTNFIHQMGNCAISVAWYKHGEPFYGAVYDPNADEFFEAKAGEDALLNGKPIHVSDAPLGNSIVLFGTAPYNPELTDLTFELLRKVFGKCQDIRRMGSAALDICHVACGRAGLYFEATLSPWDYAAAALILKESGGSLVNLSGQEVRLSLEKTSVVAGNMNIIAESGIISKQK
ncbi:MAG: inositol monophosphatase [Oscillospiraceae bacterium]|nr:inositol monophosphatase [Oscillospiraceae bacterium]